MYLDSQTFSQNMEEEYQTFMVGINIKGKHARDLNAWIRNRLKTTAIKWLRIHDPFPTRNLESSNAQGYSYLNAIRDFCDSGFNLVLPIDVGIVQNDIRIGAQFEEPDSTTLEDSIEESYHYAYKGTKQICETIKSAKQVEVIFGIENEIDVKQMILQSAPLLGWRQYATSWKKMAMNLELRRRRLMNICKGVHKACKETGINAKTLINMSCDDVKDVFESHKISEEFLGWFEQLGVSDKVRNALDDEYTPRRLYQDVLNFVKDVSPNDEAMQRFDSWELDLERTTKELDEELSKEGMEPIDYIGVDTYPDYFSLESPKGKKVGEKVEIAEKIIGKGKKIINLEFGHHTFSTGNFLSSILQEIPNLEEFVNRLLGKATPSENQLEFFRDALESISQTASIGTFPWVLITEPDIIEKYPLQEAYFGLIKQRADGTLKEEPAFLEYVRWSSETLKNTE